MTFDERIDRLTERHEALTYSVELLEGKLERLSGFVNEIAEGTVRLLRAVESHERRLNDLEGD